MKLSINKILLLILLISGLAGCEELPLSSEFQNSYAVEAYMIADQRLPTVYLTRTMERGVALFDDSGTYNQDLYVTTGQVEISLLDENGSALQTFAYTRSKSNQYNAVDREYEVEPGKSYRLVATFEDGSKLSAETLVPGEIQTLSQSTDTLVYKNSPQLEIRTTPGHYPGRDNYYVLTLEGANKQPDNLTPYYKDLVLEKGLHIYTFVKNTSGITSAEHYPQDEQGNLIVDVPWSSFAFYGKNKVRVSTIDDNLYDFWSSIQHHGGGMILTGGDLKNVKYNVEGGIGIFGSLSETVNEVTLLKPE